MAISGSGDILVADTVNNRIQKFDLDGNHLLSFGSLGTGDGEFELPGGIAVSSNDFVYVADSFNDRIQKFDIAGTHLESFGSSGTGNGQFNQPGGVAVNEAGEIFVADTFNDRIQRLFDPQAWVAGEHTFVNARIGPGGFGQPLGDSLTLTSDMTLIANTVSVTGTGSLTVDGGELQTTNIVTVQSSGTLDVKSGEFTSPEVQVDSGGSLKGNGTITGDAEIDGKVSGNVTITGDLSLNSGSTVSPGNSPGTINAGNTVFSGAGNYNWQIFDANGAPGVGYDLLNITGSLTTTAASGFNINLWSLSEISPDVNGDAINFDNTQAFTFTLAQTTGGVIGFNAANFNIVTAANNGTGGYTNALNGGAFNLGLASGGNNLVLNFSPGTAIPEPSSLVLLSLGVAGMIGSARRRGRQTQRELSDTSNQTGGASDSS